MVEPIHHPNPLTPIQSSLLYQTLLSTFLNTLVIDVQANPDLPQLVGALYKRSITSFPVLLPRTLNDLCLKLHADERLASASLIVFYDEAGLHSGYAAQFASLLNLKYSGKCTYLQSGMHLFAQLFPTLVEKVNDKSIPTQISRLREQQSNLIEAVWYSYRSQTYDVPHMIINNYLYLGGQDAAHPTNLHNYQITHVLRIGYFDDLPISPTVIYATFSLEDTDKEPIDSIFDECCKFIHNAFNIGRVLVHCHAGVSRSTTIVLVYLMRYLNLSLYQAFDLCFKARPIVRPNEGFGRLLQAEECKLFELECPSVPLCWMSFDYSWYREYLEFLIRIEEMTNPTSVQLFLPDTPSVSKLNDMQIFLHPGPASNSAPESIAPAATNEVQYAPPVLSVVEDCATLVSVTEHNIV